ncbi:hypothetical protein [Microbacterium thalassium]|uniref:Putative YccA/Bax inhibitor family protein n=1 Tax=Microbacterium thalassium TaxID=362649 RepID=A0A7X0FNG7_9MICO|nr:hypothetical protein [Microbacterium thalassium]MBB6390743.1 putative YccA/Bax inhibitor family protein [Microbacterium thalassium]GLK25851.1 hypothetical protein GCM10017607_31700 [Microbacterium thalassium]
MRSWTIAPRTPLGGWSLGLGIAVPVLLAVGSFTATLLEVPSADTILGDVLARPGVALPMLAGMLCALASLITGLVAFFARADRSILVLAAFALCGLFVLFLIAEFALSPWFPH